MSFVWPIDGTLSGSTTLGQSRPGHYGSEEVPPPIFQSARAIEYTDCISAEGYDIKHFDCEAPVMLELWEMQSTPSLPPLPGPHWPGVVAPDWVSSTVQVELFDI